MAPRGPIVAMGGDTNGWALYLKDGVPSFCYNLIALHYTYIRGDAPLGAGRHTLRYEFQKTGSEPYGAGGTGRLFVDDNQVGEAQLPKTAAFGYSLDETFDIGCDKGAPVTEEYQPLAEFTGTVIKVEVDLKPDLIHQPERQAEADARHAMVRQ